MAHVPLPRSELTDRVVRAERRIAAAVPPPVLDVLERLRGAGFAAYVVGGSIRDVLMDRPAHDWDLASSARPEAVLTLFPGAVYENRFGTVGIRSGEDVHEVTTFRHEHEYADFRRPHRIEFGESIDRDLARRDFTVNALAWGGEGTSGGERLLDPYGGLDDLDARLLRTVGDPDLRFREDALRMLRAARFAAVLELAVEPATLAAISRNASLAAHLSGERVLAELERILLAPRPSVGLALLERTGLLVAILPELAAQRGVGQNKIEGEDLWDHTVRTVDASARDQTARFAALLHDVGKPATAADGHFYGHDRVGAAIARDVLRRLRAPRPVIDRVVPLVRQHMFAYEPAWGDPAVRRFISKIGPHRIEELLSLRAADNVGSGLDPDAGRLGELRARIADELVRPLALDRTDLAIDGRDLIEALGFTPGPALGRVLHRLLERVIVDPALNRRDALLALAAAMKANVERHVADGGLAAARRRPRSTARSRTGATPPARTPSDR